MNTIQTFRAALVLAAGAAIGLAPASAEAQEWGVVRRTFTYVDSRLLIDVRADIPGELQIVRGGFGQVEVAARADQGLAGMALGRRDELVLTAMGAGRVQYLVMVPDNARVRVRVPGQRISQVFGPFSGQARYRWGGERPAVRPAAAARGIEVTTLPQGGPYVAHTEGRAPDAVEILDPSDASAVRVHVGGEEFRLETDRPLSGGSASGRVVEISSDGDPLEVTMAVPRGTDSFTLRIGGADALRIRGGRAQALCRPVVEQRLAGGEAWFTFTVPQDGRLECGR